MAKCDLLSFSSSFFFYRCCFRHRCMRGYQQMKSSSNINFKTTSSIVRATPWPLDSLSLSLSLSLFLSLSLSLSPLSLSVSLSLSQSRSLSPLSPCLFLVAFLSHELRLSSHSPCLSFPPLFFFFYALFFSSMFFMVSMLQISLLTHAQLLLRATLEGLDEKECLEVKNSSIAR